MAKKKKKIGRPRIGDKLRSKLIAFRVDEETYNLIERAAITQGIKTSEFAEECAIRCAGRTLR